MVNKINHLQSLAYSFCYNIIAISETWLSDSIFTSEILPSNFTIYRCDHRSHGVGVMLAVKDNISSQLLSSTSIPVLEALTVQIGTNQPLIICLAYIPPRSKVQSCEPFFISLNYLGNKCSSLLIMGDFNVPDINWNTLSSTS